MKKALFILFALFFATSTINSQTGKMAVGGQAGISLPMGDFGDAANLGFGFLGNFFYGVTNDIDLTGSIGYFTWGGDVPSGSNADVSFSDVPVIAGARYYFQRQAFTPYGVAELGLHFFSGGVDFSYVDPFTGQTVSSSADNSSTEFGLGLGGGFLYDLGNMTLDVNAKINIVSDANHISVMAGIRYPLK